MYLIENTCQPENESIEHELSFPVYRDDFLPLLMQYEGHYWSGYYTSRPNFKRLVRDFTNQAFNSLQFFSFTLLQKNQRIQFYVLQCNFISLQDNETFKKRYGRLINALQQELSLLMHHDTITGTSRNNVIQHAVNQAESILSSNSQMYSALLGKKLTKLTGIHTRDVMLHLLPKWEKGRYQVPIEVKGETLITVVNPSLDWLDSVELHVKGWNGVKVYRWDVERQRYERVSGFQESIGPYYEKSCFNNTETERVCVYTVHINGHPWDRRISVCTAYFWPRFYPADVPGMYKSLKYITAETAEKYSILFP